MHKIITALRKIRLAKVLTAFVAGILLFFSTACNSVQAETPNSAVNPRPEIPNEDPRATGYRGGMNDFSDVDPRAKDIEKATAGKAEALKQRAARNIEEKSIDSPEQYVKNYREGTPLGERVKRFGDDVKSSTDEITEDVSKGTKQGLENVKENVRNTTEGVTSKANQAAENVKAGTKDAARDLDRSTNRAADNVRQAGRGAADSTQRAADNTSNLLQDKTNDAGKATQRALYKAGDKVGEAVD